MCLWINVVVSFVDQCHFFITNHISLHYIQTMMLNNLVGHNFVIVILIIILIKKKEKEHDGQV